MADSAFQTMYRNEYIAGFEQRQSLLRQSVTSEGIAKGNQFVFLVADSGNAEAVTRGLNGLIPGRPDNLNQYTVQLEEWHDKAERTGFNVFSSQGDARRIMQETSMGVINRKADQQIIDQLNTATQDTGAATTATLTLVMKSVTILGNNEVPFDDGLTAVVTPAFMSYLQQVKEFSSADWVTKKPLDSGNANYTGQPGFYMWNGIKWITHSRLPGRGTNAEKCFLFHRSAIGHAAPSDMFQTFVGYNEENDYSFARCTTYANAKLLQNSGVVVMNHDGSAYVAS